MEENKEKKEEILKKFKEIIDRDINIFLLTDRFYSILYTNVSVLPSFEVEIYELEVTENQVLKINPEAYINIKESINRLNIIRQAILRLALFHHELKVKEEYENVYNISSVLASGQYLNKAKDGTIIKKEADVYLNEVSKKINKPLEEFKDIRYYFNILKEYQDKTNDDCSSMNQGLGKVNYNIDPSDIENTILQSNNIKATIDEALKKEGGKLPGDLAGALAQLIEIPQLVESKISWQERLRQFNLQNGEKLDFQSNPLRGNLVYENEEDIHIRTTQHKRTGKILFICDSSGSMSVDDFLLAANEMSFIQRLGYQVDFGFIDTKFYYEGKFDKNKEITIKGGGGTDFTDAIEFLNKTQQYSAAVFFTDAYGNCGVQPEKNVLWLSTTPLEDSWVQKLANLNKSEVVIFEN